ncbi:MAG: mechanosensitive ion channel domain-containing protein [Pseudomonadota bacterium]
MPRSLAASHLVRVLALAVMLVGLTAAGDVRAQGLPIPGLPGGLGGLTTPDTPADPTPPAGAAPTDPAASPSGSAVSGAPPGETAGTPTQALIDILRDDTAREALIRELEAASGQGAASAPPTTEIPDPAVDPPVETFGDRAVAATRAIGSALVANLETIWLRMQRVPTTFELSLRALEDGELATALREVLVPGVFLYAMLILLRLLIRPLRRRAARAAEGASWTKKLMLRVVASGLHVVTIPLAVMIGLIWVVISGHVRTNEADEMVLSDAQALFVNAFVTVEFARVGLRFILSPGTPALRMIALPEAGIANLWRMGWVVLYVIGYGQLFLVPAISGGVSIFVGRAVAAVMSATVVAALIVYVLFKRKQVADWLSPPDSENPLVQTLRPLAKLWFWPVLLYLVYLLVTVLTRPGNVLLPLLQTTGEMIVVIVVGSMILNGLTERSSRRMPIPKAVQERLPLLEERINQIRPAFLTVLRFFVFFVMLLLLLNVLGLQGIGGLISSAVLEQFSSGLFSVVLIVGLLSLAWLGMTSWVDYRLNPFVGPVPTPREITLLTLMKNALTVAIVIVGIITSLAQLGMNVGPLIASAGVIGLAISFGAQRMVEDIFSGVFIQAENAMNVGDVVDVGGTVGTVEKLTVRSVTLRDLSGVVHVIPFSSAAKVSNYMRDFAYHVADMGVAYREDVDEVRQAMHDAFDALRADPEHAKSIMGDLEWFGLNAFGPSELVVRARIKTLPGQQWGIGRAYNAIVKDIFDTRGIEIPFPHQTVYFGEDKHGKAPPLHMHVSRTASQAPVALDGSAKPVGLDERRADAPLPGSDIPDEDGR